jgi:hypothetical protein
MNAVYRWGFLQDPDGVTGFAGRAGWIEMRRVRPAP